MTNTVLIMILQLTLSGIVSAAATIITLKVSMQYLERRVEAIEKKIDDVERDQKEHSQMLFSLEAAYKATTDNFTGWLKRIEMKLDRVIENRDRMS